MFKNPYETVSWDYTELGHVRLDVRLTTTGATNFDCLYLLKEKIEQMISNKQAMEAWRNEQLNNPEPPIPGDYFDDNGPNGE